MPDPYIRAWDKLSERLLKQLNRDTRVYVKEPKIVREFGYKCSHLIDNDYMDIGRIDKKKQSIIALRPEVMTFPKISKGMLQLHFKKIKI